MPFGRVERGSRSVIVSNRHAWRQRGAAVGFGGRERAVRRGRGKAGGRIWVGRVCKPSCLWRRQGGLGPVALVQAGPSHAASRSQVVPASATPLADVTDKPAPKSRYIPWRDLLRRTFAIDIVCGKCHSPLRLIALIKTEAIAKKILAAMHLPTELGPARPAPAPRGFAAPVAELHPARPPPRETKDAENWVN